MAILLVAAVVLHLLAIIATPAIPFLATALVVAVVVVLVSEYFGRL